MINIDEKSISRKDSISVEFFYENTERLFALKLLTDTRDLSRKIYEQNLHRPGLALAGFVDLFPYKRVQLLGNTELKYFYNLLLIQHPCSMSSLLYGLYCIISKKTLSVKS